MLLYSFPSSILHVLSWESESLSSLQVYRITPFPKASVKVIVLGYGMRLG